MHQNNLPIVAISLGDPNGIGPEIIIKALLRRDIQSLGTFVVFAPINIWNYYKKLYGEGLVVTQIEKLEDIRNGKIHVLNLGKVDFKVELGQSTIDAGKIAFDSLQAATEAVKEKQCDLLVTAPINKSNIQSEAFKFPGHTEYLEKSWGGQNLMFMVHEDIKIGLVTQHIPLKDVNTHLSHDAITAKLKGMHQSLKQDFGIREPKIAVLGLNPHAGDSGLLGKEEEEMIIPVIQKMLEQGIKVFGPFPSDSFFSFENLSKFDGILAMYHDQGLIPFKTLAGLEGVNFTAGLPFVRTSPDHGVGYDIADQGIADETSMVEAIYAAIEIYQKRQMMQDLTSNTLQLQPESRSSRRSARFE